MLFSFNHEIATSVIPLHQLAQSLKMFTEHFLNALSCNNGSEMRLLRWLLPWALLITAPTPNIAFTISIKKNTIMEFNSIIVRNFYKHRMMVRFVIARFLEKIVAICYFWWDCFVSFPTRQLAQPLKMFTEHFLNALSCNDGFFKDISIP